jgi:hypothetical protein
MAADVLWQRQGRAGGAVSRAQRRPPTCFGSKRCANNRARGAAKGLFQVAPGLCQRPLVAAAFTQELALSVPAHRGRWCSARGKSLPPTRPAAWPSFWGRVGGALSRVQLRRPQCAGTKRCSNNAATPAANKRFPQAQPLEQWHAAANALSARVMPCPC